MEYVIGPWGVAESRYSLENPNLPLNSPAVWDEVFGTQWETGKRKSYSATVRPNETGSGYVAKILGTLVRVIQRGKDWAIQP